jgi:hypothetical protein
MTLRLTRPRHKIWEMMAMSSSRCLEEGETQVTWSYGQQAGATAVYKNRRKKGTLFKVLS